MPPALARTARALVLWCVALPSIACAQVRTLDDGHDASAWTVATSSGVDLHIRSEAIPDVKGGTNAALRIDYDFTRGSGFGIVRKPIRVDLPANYRFTYRIRGEGPSNTVEFKLLDPSGDNVWWVNQRDFQFTRDWKEIVLPKRKISFAWGPAGAHTPLARAENLEIAITASSGGKGTVWIDDLTFEPLPEVRPYAGTPTVTVSSAEAGTPNPPTLAHDGTLNWSSGPNDATPSISFDFGEVRELGGLILDWDSETYDVLVDASVGSPSKPGSTRTWVHQGRRHPGRQYVPIPDLTARTVTVTTTAGDSKSGIPTRRLKSIRFMPPEFGEDRNELIRSAAADAPRGQFPRSFIGESIYFTVIGASGDTNEALVSEDGAVEVNKLAFSIEPFLAEDSENEQGRAVHTWADAKITHDQIDSELPMPVITRDHAGLALTTTAWVEGEAGASNLLIRYTVKNDRKLSVQGRLYAAIRPFQVNPPYQNLNIAGGAAQVAHIKGDTLVTAVAVHVDGRVVIPLDALEGFIAVAWTAGEVAEHIVRNTLPFSDSVTDGNALASAAMEYPYNLAPGESKSWHILVPMHDKSITPTYPPVRAAYGEQSFQRTRNEWRERLNRVTIDLPKGQERLAHSVRANLAYILINRDGPSIQPGSRCYERTWIRDGSLTSAALLSFGFEREVKEFLDWFAPLQYADGKIPCCADRRGPDPVPEHDSHGQYIYAVKHYYDMTGDEEFLKRHYPRMLKAVEYIEFLRAQRLTPEYVNAPDDSVKRSQAGIMPESISHEGYSAKPMHSYWDDFFTAKGIADAADAARIVGDTDNAARLDGLSTSFMQSINESLRRAMARCRIDYLPGCAELGDFDATSTTVALYPCGLRGRLDENALQRTFEKYWTNFLSRRDSGKPWRDYTPYELRAVGSMILLEHREHAMDMLNFFLNDQRPNAATGSAGGGGFHQWPEVIFHDPRQQGYVGDMPHTWCGSDFINSVRLMLAYEERTPQGDALVLGAGVPLAWALDAKGVRVKGLRTAYGPLEFAVCRDTDVHSPNAERTAVYTLSPLPHSPPGGVFVSVPNADRIESVRIDGQESPKHVAGRIRIEPGKAVRVTWKP